MKLYVYLMLFLLIGVSCKKDERAISLMTGDSLLKAISNLKTIDDQKLAYSTLKSEERLALWKSKLDSDIKSNLYSHQQVNQINNLINYLSLKIFHKGKEKDIFNLIIFPNWVKSSKNILSSFEIQSLVFSFKGAQTNLTELPVENCKCAVGSNFTCPSYSTSGVSWGICSKNQKACNESSSGCGAFFDNECDGNVCQYN